MKTVDREPKTKGAFLPNSEGRATWHQFERAEEGPGADGDVGVVFLYRCFETGELRAWGFEYTDADLRRPRMRALP